MKKVILFAVMAVAAMCAKAEGLYVGGQVGFWHGTTDNVGRTNQMTILPEIGYNLSEKWAIGTQIGYDYTHICNAKTSVNLFQFNPYARWTFFKSESNFVNLFVDGTVGVGAGWASYDGDSSDTAVTYQVGLRPGIALNFDEHFSFVAHVGMLGYQGANDEAKLAGYTTEGGLLLNGNNLTFGFLYKF